jgi:hypothetical protein
MQKSIWSVARYFLAMILSGTDKDGSPFGLSPENEEAVALASAIDTAGGRTSEDIINKYGHGIAVLIDVTELNGSATLDGCVLEAKVGQGYIVLAGVLGTPITAIGQNATWFCPNKPNNSEGFVRTYRLRTVSTTDDEGNDITYSVTVVHLL